MTGVKRILTGALAGACLGLLFGSSPVRSGPQTTPQEPPPQDIQKPSYNYMDGFLSRSKHPLGLKEDPAARRMLSQGAVPWAIRAGSRHVLD
jgi:hypothetical protein